MVLLRSAICMPVLCTFVCVYVTHATHRFLGVGGEALVISLKHCVVYLRGIVVMRLTISFHLFWTAFLESSSPLLSAERMLSIEIGTSISAV